MANIHDIYDSGTSLKAEDLKGKRVPLTISEVEIKEYTDDGKAPERKLFLSFSGKDKGLTLNKTNSAAIAELHGEDYEQWPGKDITIFPTKVDFGGKMVDAIRVFQPVPEEADGESVPF